MMRTLCVPVGGITKNKKQASKEGAVFLMENASVLSAAALAFLFFCALTRLFSDGGDER